jgi:hypothetical protein
MTSLYWSMVTMATLGYGDVTPKTYAEVIYVTIAIFIGAACYAVVVGMVSHVRAPLCCLVAAAALHMTNAPRM